MSDAMATATRALELELEVAKASERLESLREKFHAARDKGQVPPKLREDFRAAQREVVSARQAHRHHGVENGLRPSPGSVPSPRKGRRSTANPSPATVSTTSGVNGQEA